MKKISGRDIALFVSGAFAISGFRTLIWLPYYLVVSRDLVHIVGAIVSGLALPIGIGILLNRSWAIASARAYLWAVIILGCITVPLTCYFIPVKNPFILWSSLDFLTYIGLLILIHWSRSRKFKESDAAQSN
ncbi:MAG TPA: hypothetical protein VFV23_03655 [Verrucomicrobiae bacterium]|nr:hypothetical protein [Verrucomicrobiae bacterium]